MKKNTGSPTQGQKKTEVIANPEKKKLPLFTYVKVGCGGKGFFRKPTQEERRKAKSKTSFIVALDVIGNDAYKRSVSDMYNNRWSLHKQNKSTYLVLNAEKVEETYLKDSRKKEYWNNQYVDIDCISQELFDEMKNVLGWSNRYSTGAAIELLHNVMFKSVGFLATVIIDQMALQ